MWPRNAQLTHRLSSHLGEPGSHVRTQQLKSQLLEYLRVKSWLTFADLSSGPTLARAEEEAWPPLELLCWWNKPMAEQKCDIEVRNTGFGGGRLASNLSSATDSLCLIQVVSPPWASVFISGEWRQWSSRPVSEGGEDLVNG